MGHAVGPYMDNAVCWCWAGAISKVTPNLDTEFNVRVEFQRDIPDCTPIERFNDDFGYTAVMDQIQKTITRLNAQQI